MVVPVAKSLELDNTIVSVSTQNKLIAIQDSQLLVNLPVFSFPLVISLIIRGNLTNVCN